MHLPDKSKEDDKAVYEALEARRIMLTQEIDRIRYERGLHIKQRRRKLLDHLNVVTGAMKKLRREANSASMRAARMVQAGTHSKMSAARACGVTHSAVSYSCKKLGIPDGLTPEGARALRDGIRKRRKWMTRRGPDSIDLDHDMVKDHVVEGMTYEQLAEKYQITRSAVAGRIWRLRRELKRADRVLTFP
jgi:biotin operon repressor